ncbi:CPA2 family monovalent cation:H+ antiporter-2/glutathione-regulated potassium-efflux system protein KefB [Novosphingobium chloroacetimidivorans]|uniref:CPA2 family monovalent cation:H+ antiporter-2/glutathione-regulated potassium-efflux system protein KefB n=1 Tax=Novosphingobium chloroacetimidivorans TaxID=1428314 RepID=A0A7W7NVI2_9SPHN|nr:cation:proton antiporter [Novosphingobium chloroacetimidivorans]MBB4857329.1 CPA2 family monovalent cation:H+ antiporter-2/glutathione-regulated potassium-efflux system protein KefB [Novosphingobium chloroacetimidivorans]
MEEHAQSFLLQDGFLLLGTALVFVLVFRRLGLGATLGYIMTGAVLGPYALHLVGDPESKIGIAELGITLLLFIVGLELAPHRLWRMRHEIFGLGLLQVAACGLAVTGVIYALTHIFSDQGFTWTAALALGLPLGLSSTAQVLPMLQSAGRLHTPFGERAFAILLFQDLSIIPLITIIAAMSRNPAAAAGPPGWLLVIYTLVAVAGLIAAGRFVIRPLFRLIGNLGEREMFVFAGLFTVIASAAAMELLGLSTALGAFIAGVMLADSPYRHELEADVEPFRTILLGLFFMSVGMMLDLQAIAQRPVYVLSMALALIVTKAVVIFGIGKLFRMDWRGALALGLLLSQGGEFGFVLFAQAQEALLISPLAGSVFTAVVTLSMVSTPFLMMATRRMREAPASKEERDEPQIDGSNALVVGYGRFGQTVAQMLIAADIPVTLIDTDVEMIDIAEGFGAKVYFGDGTRIDLLRQAGAAEAELIAFCIDGDQISEDFLHGVHTAFPRAEILVRAFDRRTMLKLKDAPVRRVVREVLESAVTMGRAALDALDVSLPEIDRAEAAYRSRDKERLKAQFEAGELTAARDRIFTQPARERR